MEKEDQKKKSTEERLEEIVNMLNEKLFVKKATSDEDDKSLEDEEEKSGEDLDSDYEAGEDEEHKKKVKPNLFSNAYDKLKKIKK